MKKNINGHTDFVIILGNNESVLCVWLDEAFRDLILTYLSMCS